MSEVNASINFRKHIQKVQTVSIDTSTTSNHKRKTE